MRKLLAVLSLLLLLGPLGPVPAWSISDPGNPAVTRLWGYDGSFGCSAFYLDKEAPPGHAWVGSVQHCTHLTWLARSPWDEKQEVRWIDPQPYSSEGAAIGLVKDDRPVKRYLKLADSITSSQPIYFHGFHAGVEITGFGSTVEPSSTFQGSWLALNRLGHYQGPGSSGSPVFNGKGELIGFVWGGFPGTGLYIITPYAPIQAAMDAAKLPVVAPVPLPPAPPAEA